MTAAPWEEQNRCRPWSASVGDRRRLWDGQRWTWDNSQLSTVRACRRHTLSGYSTVLASPERRVAELRGLKTCGSVWACPMCSRNVWARRGHELTEALHATRDRGGSVLLVTLTMRHKRADLLTDLLDGLSTAWRAIGKSKRVRLLNEHADRIGTVRRIEINHGDSNGWHAHVHALVFLGREVDPAVAAHIGAAMFTPWSTALAKLGFAPSEKYGVDVKLLDLNNAAQAVAGYVTAGTTPERAAFEVTDGGIKRGRNGNRTAFEIHADAVDGCERSAALWAAYERATQGRRAMDGQSRLFRALGLSEPAESPDEGEELDAELEPVAHIRADIWTQLCRVPLSIAAVLETAEAALRAEPDWQLAKANAARAVEHAIASMLPPPGAPTGPDSPAPACAAGPLGAPPAPAGSRTPQPPAPRPSSLAEDAESRGGAPPLSGAEPESGTTERKDRNNLADPDTF